MDTFVSKTKVWVTFFPTLAWIPERKCQNSTRGYFHRTPIPTAEAKITRNLVLWDNLFSQDFQPINSRIRLFGLGLHKQPSFSGAYPKGIEPNLLRFPHILNILCKYWLYAETRERWGKSPCPGQAELVFAGQVKLSCFLLAGQKQQEGVEAQIDSAAGLGVTKGLRKPGARKQWAAGEGEEEMKLHIAMKLSNYGKYRASIRKGYDQG